MVSSTAIADCMRSTIHTYLKRNQFFKVNSKIITENELNTQTLHMKVFSVHSSNWLFCLSPQFVAISWGLCREFIYILNCICLYTTYNKTFFLKKKKAFIFSVYLTHAHSHSDHSIATKATFSLLLQCVFVVGVGFIFTSYTVRDKFRISFFFHFQSDLLMKI